MKSEVNLVLCFNTLSSQLYNRVDLIHDNDKIVE